MKRLVVSVTMAFGAVLLPLAAVPAHAATTHSVHRSLHLRPLPALGVHKLLWTRTLHSDQSTNWSGYADTNSTFSNVTGSWTQPQVSCPNNSFLGLFPESSYSAFWVGLDGEASSSVEQIGTDSDCDSTTPTYYAWYELFPAGSVDLSTSSYPVSAGDHLTGTVTSLNASTFSLTLVDSSSSHPGWTYKSGNMDTGSNAARSSAEWVAEAPSTCTFLFCSVNSLADFGTVTFTNASATAGKTGPISAFDPVEVVMNNGNQTEAQPSALEDGGTAFSVSYEG